VISLLRKRGEGKRGKDIVVPIISLSKKVRRESHNAQKQMILAAIAAANLPGIGRGKEEEGGGGGRRRGKEGEKKGRSSFACPESKRDWTV